MSKPTFALDKEEADLLIAASNLLRDRLKAAFDGYPELALGHPGEKDATGNLVISEEDLAFIRSLNDFDMVMILSEINDHGWAHTTTAIETLKHANF